VIRCNVNSALLLKGRCQAKMAPLRSLRWKKYFASKWQDFMSDIRDRLGFFKQFFQFYRDFFQEWLVIFVVNNGQELILKITNYKLQNTNKFQNTMSKGTNCPIVLMDGAILFSPKAYKNCP
jgi:hypothetical protein